MARILNPALPAGTTGLWWFAQSLANLGEVATGDAVLSGDSGQMAQLSGGRIVHDNVDDKTILAGNHLDVLTATDAVTIMLALEKSDGTNRDSTPFRVENEGGSDRCQAHVPWLDGTVYWDWGGSSFEHRISKSGLTTSGLNIWAFTVGSRGPEIWLNGTRVEVQPTYVPSNHSGGSGKDFLIGKGDLFSVPWFFIHSTQLSEALIAAISADPQGELTAEPTYITPAVGTLALGGLAPHGLAERLTPGAAALAVTGAVPTVTPGVSQAVPWHVLLPYGQHARPPAGRKISLRHRLSAGLAFGCAYNEAKPTYGRSFMALPQDLVSPRAETIATGTNTGSVWEGGPLGIGFKCSRQNYRPTFASPTRGQFLLAVNLEKTAFNYLDDLSLFFLGTVTGAAGASRQIAAQGTGGVFSNSWEFRVNASNLLEWTMYENFGASESAVGATAIAVDERRVRSFGVSRSAKRGRIAVYLDGREDGSSTSLVSGIVTGGTLGQDYEGLEYLLLIWRGVALGPQDFLSLHTSPWQMFAPPAYHYAFKAAELSLTPAVATLSLTGAPPTLPQAAVSRTPSAGALVFTGGSPTHEFDVPQTRTPAAGALAVAGAGAVRALSGATSSGFYNGRFDE